tara:strand:- start:2040 stop:2807 length:768 start_codon:yes stop_codon:yes gene_type:complete
LLKEKYYIYGKHAVLAALKNSERNIQKIFIDKSDNELQKTIRMLLVKANSKNLIELVHKSLIENKLKNKVKHQGVIVQAKKLHLHDFMEIINNNNKYSYKYGVILDSLTDVNNIGAIYRSAKAFGIDFIINTKRKSVLETSSLLNVACGTFDTLKTFTTNNIVNAIQKLKDKNWWIIGMDHLGNININKVLEKMNNDDKCIFVLGSEGKGIRRLVKNNCHFLANIPTMSDANSINVSNAAVIVFYQLYLKSLQVK